MARGEDPAISFFHVSRPLNLGARGGFVPRFFATRKGEDEGCARKNRLEQDDGSRITRNFYVNTHVGPKYVYTSSGNEKFRSHRFYTALLLATRAVRRASPPN